MVPSLGMDTALYATFVPSSRAFANVLVVKLSFVSLITLHRPFMIWEEITPELPLAPRSAPRDTASQISVNWFDVQAFISFTADCSVSDMFVPVSPSGTGKTLSESTFVRPMSIILDPD